MMPYPVPPPEPPAIIQILSADAKYQCEDISCNVSQIKTTSSRSNRVASNFAISTAPETFAVDISPLGVSKSAALLGPPISRGGERREEGGTTSIRFPEFTASNSVTNSIEQLTQNSARLEKGEESKEEGGTTSIRFPEFTASNSVTNSIEQLTQNSDRTYRLEPNTKNLKDEAEIKAKASLQNSQPSVTIPAQQLNGNIRELEFSSPAPDNAQQLNGNIKELEFRAPVSEDKPQASNEIAQTTTPSNAIPPIPLGTGGIIELNADRQEYDAERQIVTAEGNVVLRFQNAILDADRLQVNLTNRLIVATGRVSLRRGQQVLRGDRFEYDFIQDSGVILKASGEVYQSRAAQDLAPPLPNDINNASFLQRPLSDRITATQPLQQITNPGGLSVVVGAGANAQDIPPQGSAGTVNRLRFQADRLEFDSESWRARDIRITNDVFSPPELELRADTAEFKQIAPQISEITTTRSRLVFDQKFQLPLFQDRRRIDRRPRDPGFINVGFDNGDRGGLFIERTFDLINTPSTRLGVTPQYFVQKTFREGRYFDPSIFGLRVKLDSLLSNRTVIVGSADLPSLDVNTLENRTRASLRLRQTIGTTLPHTLNLEYSYRDRLFNGSLGFQTVQNSFGAVLTSPVITLGKTGINLTYQAGAQYINADTDRADLLKPNRLNNRVSLARYQGSASVNRGFLLWQGQGLPATATEGLRYTPAPVVPYMQLNVGVTGVSTGYSNGDIQNSASGNIGIIGQIGNFSRPYLDYTGFNISYSQIIPTGQSPFLFDRVVDTRVLSGGIIQQVYGPFRTGFQTAINLDNRQVISTDYILEYSRRTYNISLRYNPVLQIGSLNLRINDFNWFGSPEPFDDTGIRPVVQGVTR